MGLTIRVTELFKIFEFEDDDKFVYIAADDYDMAAQSWTHLYGKIDILPHKIKHVGSVGTEH